MSQQEKAALYQELKEAGVQFSKHYREYTEADLRAAVEQLREGQREAAAEAEANQPAAPAQPNDGYGDLPPFELGEDDVIEDVPGHSLGQRQAPAPQVEQTVIHGEPRANPGSILQTAGGQQWDLSGVPVRPADPNELPGQMQSSGGPDVPKRIDPVTGHIWFQEEVKKPAMPKPRARRVVEYMDPGVKEQQLKSGDFTERFEVAGDGQGVQAQVKVTLPSYQVGIFQDPRMPFRTYVYNEQQGFDFFEVQNFYGGPEMVPPEIKRIYVSNVLCFDIRTTVRAITDEYRERVLTGNIKELQA